MKDEQLEPRCSLLKTPSSKLTITDAKLLTCCVAVFWATVQNIMFLCRPHLRRQERPETSNMASKFPTSPRARIAVETIQIVLSRKGDTNTLSFLQAILVFIHYMRRQPFEMIYLEKRFHLESLVAFLNTLLVSPNQQHTREDGFPTPLPEEFAMHVLHFSQDYFTTL